MKGTNKCMEAYLIHFDNYRCLCQSEENKCLWTHWKIASRDREREINHIIMICLFHHTVIINLGGIHRNVGSIKIPHLNGDGICLWWGNKKKISNTVIRNLLHNVSCCAFSIYFKLEAWIRTIKFIVIYFVLNLMCQIYDTVTLWNI